MTILRDSVQIPKSSKSLGLLRLATEEAAAEPASQKDVQRDDSRRSSTEIYLLPGPKAGSRLN